VSVVDISTHSGCGFLPAHNTLVGSLRSVFSVDVDNRGGARTAAAHLARPGR